MVKKDNHSRKITLFSEHQDLNEEKKEEVSHFSEFLNSNQQNELEEIDFNNQNQNHICTLKNT